MRPEKPAASLCDHGYHVDAALGIVVARTAAGHGRHLVTSERPLGRKCFVIHSSLYALVLVWFALNQRFLVGAKVLLCESSVVRKFCCAKVL